MTYARVRHFPEVYGLSYVAYQRQQKPNGFPSQGYPEVFKTVSEADDRPVSLTPALEEFWLRLLAEGSGLARDKVLQAYGNLTMDGRAFTDRGSWTNGYQSVPLGENIGAEPMKMVTIIGCGMTVKVISDQLTLGNGLKVHKIEVLNSLDPLTLKATRKTHWWAVYNAPIGYYDPYPLGVVGTFPQLAGQPVSIPLMAHGKNYAYIESKWLEFLPDSTNKPVYPYYPIIEIEENVMTYGTAKTTSGKVAVFDLFQGAKTGAMINALTVFNWKVKQANWLQLVDNTWVNCGSSFQYVNIQTYPTDVVVPPPPPPPPPPVGVTVTHTILIDNTGRISIDGGAYV